MRSSSFNVDARLNPGRAIRMTATHASIAQLLGQFERNAGRPLFDHTGLSGFYNFVLEFDSRRAAAAPDEPGGDVIGQAFSTAIEKQLGLKLESSSASFDTVVIDHAVKPSAN